MNYKEIYLNNNYEIDKSFTFTLKEFDSYKNSSIFQKDFAIITAYNPNNVLLSDKENSKRDMALKKEIESFGFLYFRARGYLDSHSEDGFLIFSISFKEAIKLALKYEQYAIFYNNSLEKRVGYYDSFGDEIVVVQS